LVYPAASLPERAIERGVKTIEINLDPSSPISTKVDIFLQGKAKELCTRLVDLVLEQTG
jgi:NAD-dependent SIR2 family protein deacetylase